MLAEKNQIGSLDHEQPLVTRVAYLQYVQIVIVIVECEPWHELTVDLIAAKVVTVLRQLDLFVEPHYHVLRGPIVHLWMLPRLPHFVHGYERIRAVKFLFPFVHAIFVLKLLRHELINTTRIKFRSIKQYINVRFIRLPLEFLVFPLGHRDRRPFFREAFLSPSSLVYPYPLVCLKIRIDLAFLFGLIFATLLNWLSSINY